MITVSTSAVVVRSPSIDLRSRSTPMDLMLGNQTYQEVLNTQIFRFTFFGHSDDLAAVFAVDGPGQQSPIRNFTKGFEGASLSIWADPVFRPSDFIFSGANGDIAVVSMVVQYGQSLTPSSDAKQESARIEDSYSRISNISFSTNTPSLAYSPTTLWYYYFPLNMPNDSNYYRDWARNTMDETLKVFPSNGFARTFNYLYLQNFDSSKESLPIYFTYIMNARGYIYPEYYFGTVLENYSEGQHTIDILHALNVSSLQSEYGALNITCNPSQRRYYRNLYGINTGYYFRGINSNLNYTFAASTFTDQESGDGFKILLNASAPITTLNILFDTVSHPSLSDIIEENSTLFLFLPVLILLIGFTLTFAIRKMKRASLFPQHSADGKGTNIRSRWTNEKPLMELF